ncbi:enoyl-CoA hydratase/isomerase family protein [Micromonospora sp. NPDC005215]|uniref:enoyl-CoA hydratase/isomerase family protein n=1 Tax=Micromonospora sp. NPDC005215 TaxID=3157024 RepID=UPI0033AD2414
MSDRHITAPCVSRTIHGPVAVLTMDRPDTGNVLDAEMLGDLLRHTTALADDPAVRAVVLTGTGKAFSLGGDLADFERALSGQVGDPGAYSRPLTEALGTLVRTLREMRACVIAAVNGQAAGAGFALALACDMRIASERAVLHFAYGALGASTDGGMSWFLPRVVGPARALALLLEQPIMRAPRALREGLVDEVVPATDLLDRALRTAGHLAASAPHAVAAAKRLVDASHRNTLDEHLTMEHDLFADGLRTRDMRRGLAAHRQGDVPAFEGD